MPGHLAEFPTLLFAVPLLMVAATWMVVGAGWMRVDAIDGGLGLLDRDHDGYPDGLRPVGRFAGYGRVPLLVLLTLVVVPATVASALGSAVAPEAGGRVALGALALGLLVARVGARALQPRFRRPPPPPEEHVIGRVATLVSDRVDAAFGEAEVALGDHARRLDVRCDMPTGLGRGDRVRVLGYDADRAAWLVRPDESP
jgi:hypothetical protein